MKYIFVTIFLLIPNLVFSKDLEKKNYIEVKFSIEQSLGSLTDIVGYHGAIAGYRDAGYFGPKLIDNSLYSKPNFSVSILKETIKNHWLFASYSKKKLRTNITELVWFDVLYTGKNSFPKIDFDADFFTFGYQYRFKELNIFNPYLNLGYSFMEGNQTDTNYPTKSGVGIYGIGGPKTHFSCEGLSPSIGFNFNSGFAKNFGIEIERFYGDCNNGEMRSFIRGYEANIENDTIKLTYTLSY